MDEKIKTEPVKFGELSDATQEVKTPKQIPTTVKGETPKSPHDEPFFTSKLIGEMINEAQTNANNTVGGLNLAVIGKDGTGKTGTVMDYCSRLPKKSMFIDLDGGDMKLLQTYHKKEAGSGKITVLHPLVIVEDEETKDVTIDYIKTFTMIKAILKYVKDHREHYSAIIMDGISDLLKYAENQMRMEKHIMADGGVDMRYWKNRNQRFTEVLEAMKHIPGIDKFYIGHEDFIISEKSAAIKIKFNQMVQQRILCRRIETAQADGENLIEFAAKIDKSKYNISLEGKEIVFGTIKSGVPTWDTTKIFEGL